MTPAGVFNWAAALAIAAGAVVAGRGAPARAQAPLTPVARSGDVAPGTGTATFFAYNSPVINNAGVSAFSGFLAAQPSNQDFGIWVGTPGNLSLAAREGFAAPGAGGAVFNTLSQPLIDADGNIAHFGTLTGTGIDGTNHIGLWVGTAGAMSLAARTGNVAPGTGGAGTFDFVSESTLIAGGKVSFYGSLASNAFYDGTNDDGIWAGSVGNLQLVAREGTQAAGASPGQLFGSFNITPVINASGAVAFRNVMTGTGITAGVNDRALWAGPAGGLQMLARAADVAPGIGGGIKFADFSTQPAINSAGTVAFRVTLTGGAVTAANDTSIWYGSTAANLNLLAREGEPAPGLPTDVNYGQMPDFVVLNGAGRAAFVSGLAGAGVDSTNNRAVFAGVPGGLAPVARKGAAAPGTAAGVVFNDFDFSVAMNAGGQVAFMGDLAGAGVVSGNDRGIWAVDPFGALTKIAREGDLMTLAPGDSRTVGEPGLGLFLNSAGGEGKWTSFNDAGQLSFSVFFNNNTRAVVSARVGGSARLSDTAPVFGPAVGNAYGIDTPAGFQETVAVSGDIGYLRFSGVAPAGPNAMILLDFSAATSIANAIAELERGAAVYDYTVSTAETAGAFDVLLTFVNANTGSGYFYWNFANVDNVDLVAVQVAPEPGAATLAALAAAGLLSRRRRRTPIARR